jgi:cell wall-associated NlpC family hydrolase
MNGKNAMREFDPRITPARADLAAKHLQGTVQAGRFVEGALYEIVEPQAPLRGEPRPDAPLTTEALKGERVTIYDMNAEGWAWGQLEGDRYVGWLPVSALGPSGPAATHKIGALRSFAFPGASIKLPPVEALPFGARLAIVRMEGELALTQAGNYVPAAHLVAADAREHDFVAVAERFVGVPYLWGGKTALGIDCSGLVQVALNACGVRCPRDSDMQERALGAPLAAAADLSVLDRGDLLFWQGHVAIARERGSIIHANAFHMAVAVEPIGDAVFRIGKTGSEITSVRRLSRGELKGE